MRAMRPSYFKSIRGISREEISMTTADDKRRQRRIPVELWIEAERAGELYFQRASNLSVGGAYFTQTIPLPVGTMVELKFELPGDPTEIRCKGEIVTAKDLGMGVQFIAITESDRARIEALIDKHERA
jgi:hypothetical protein